MPVCAEMDPADAVITDCTDSYWILFTPPVWCAARYDVNLTVTEFRVTPYEAIELMQHTDVFIGMHGAGMTNLLYIKPGAAVVQMHPYGWQLPSGEMIRGFYYGNMVKANKAHYLEWVNPFPEKAFMREMDFPPQNPNTPYQYSLHPLPEWGTPQTYEPPLNWIYQHTIVDLSNIGPVFEQAFELAGIPAQGCKDRRLPRAGPVWTETGLTPACRRVCKVCNSASLESTGKYTVLRTSWQVLGPEAAHQVRRAACGLAVSLQHDSCGLLVVVMLVL